eukprot:11908278-Ditylum_brightwellii.AAC.1
MHQQQSYDQGVTASCGHINHDLICRCLFSRYLHCCFIKQQIRWKEVEDAHFLVQEGSVFQQWRLLEAHLQEKISEKGFNVGREACHAQDLLKVLGQNTKLDLLCAIASSHKGGSPDPVSCHSAIWRCA